MAKYVCAVCGYTVEADEAPEKCPVCKEPKEKFNKVEEGESLVFADEHKVGSAQGLDPEVVAALRDNFNGECSEVGMYLAMSRQADREGYQDLRGKSRICNHKKTQIQDRPVTCCL